MHSPLSELLVHLEMNDMVSNIQIREVAYLAKKSYYNDCFIIFKKLFLSKGKVDSSKHGNIHIGTV